MAPHALPCSAACVTRSAVTAARSPMPGISRWPVSTIALPARSRRMTTADRAGACRATMRRSPSTPSGAARSGSPSAATTPAASTSSAAARCRGRVYCRGADDRCVLE
jgi:hypothetical protein